MKILIVLNGPGGELDRQTIETSGDDSIEVSHSIFEAIDTWSLAPGDTIVITEVE